MFYVINSELIGMILFQKRKNQKAHFFVIYRKLLQLEIVTYTSTRSTLTPHGSVASSRVDCIADAIDSRSESMSPKFFVPRTFL